MNRTPKTLVDPETGDEYKIIFPCDESSWLIRKVKKPKIIDLSPLVGSDVICAFWDINRTADCLGKLSGIRADQCYEDETGCPWGHCKPLLNHPQVYMGGDWPVPEGYLVDMYMGEWRPLTGTPPRTDNAPIIYRVTGKHPGWIEPWQEGE